MKSLQLLNKTSNPAPSRRRVHRGFAAGFAAALVLGLSATSLIAQGPYYPQTALLGGAPFDPNGMPVVSDPDLIAIENKLFALFGTKTLIIPLPAGKTAASVAEYAAAVQAVAADIAGGSPPPGVTLSSFAAEVSKYRTGGVSQVPAALQAIASGVILGGGTALDLTTVVTAAAAANPLGLAAQDYQLLLNTVAANNTMVADVDTLVAAVLNGAVSSPLGASAVQPGAITLLLQNAALAISAAPALNPATATNALKKVLTEDAASSAVAAIVASPVLNTSVNLDQATFAVTNPSAIINLNDMLVKIIAAAGAAGDDIKSGAIAQGALRNPANRNPVGYGIIKGASGNGYKDDVVDAFDAFGLTLTALEAQTHAGTYDPAAVAAAGALRFPGSAAVIVKDALIGGVPGPGAVAQNIVARGVAASQGSAVAIATLSAAGFGGALPADIAAGAITGGQIGDAGAIAKAVMLGIPLTPANATAIGDAAVAAAAAASPANVKDAYANIAYSLANALKLPGAVGDARSNAAVTAMVGRIVSINGGAATAPTYIAIISALAGNLNQNPGILGAGTGAVAGDDDAATSAGAALIVPLLTFGPYQPVLSYNTVITALAAPGSDARNLAVLYATSLVNSSDAVGGLAALIANTATSPTALTQAAISANRAKQTNLAVGGAVAAFVKTNIATINIQAYIGEQILTNPILVTDIATAGAVVVPQFSHFIAHTVGFNAPQQAYQTVAGIINHSKISIGGTLAVGDRPAAIAAISAGVTTGILESRDLSAGNKQLALRDAVRSVVVAVVGATYNDVSGTPFRRSTGGPNLVTDFTVTPATGVAGAVTGFVAQMANPGVYALPVVSDLYVALAAIKAASAVTLHIDEAQAAAQAFAWVTGGNTGQLAAAAANIAAAFGGTAAVTNAVNFGINEVVVNGNPGAGAGGLRDLVANPSAPFYDHHSAQGRPVSNMFTL